MKITTTIEINAPASAVWDVLGERFADVSEWAESILKSSINGPLERGAVRTCDIKAVGPVAAGQITEELTHFDRESFALTYNVT
ncbi:MAG: SRPBCC family protein, partial [Candidatus Neomarinimicrobiota bacterium]